MLAIILLMALPSCVFSGATQDVYAQLQTYKYRAELLNPYSLEVHGYTNYSPDGFKNRQAKLRGLQKEIASVNGSALSHFDQIFLETVKWEADIATELSQYPSLWFPYTPYSFSLLGPPRVLADFSFDSDDDVSEYLALVAKLPDVLRSMSSHIDWQTEQGVYLPRDEAAAVRNLIAGYATEPEYSFAWPSDSRLVDISAAKVTDLKSVLRRLIDDQINPALRRLAEEFDEEYQAKAPIEYGLFQYPGGKDYYRALVRFHLTIDKAPDDIYHETQAALDRIESELRSLRAEMDYFGDRETFEERLARDSRFVAKTPAEVENVYLDYMARIDPFLPKLFCRSAPYGYGVARATPDVEAALNYGNAGTQEKPVKLGMYFYNGSSLESRSLLPAQALIYHELAPGHYWHEAMRTFSRVPGASAAFSEAWADFAQVLAYEQGVFRSPEEKYGRLVFVAMFYARALADVGINYFGYDMNWGRQVLDRYTFESELQWLRSLRRDTSDWQAQILPYSLGSQELLRLREKARFVLQEKYNEARFYDAVLITGGVPFPVLATHLDWFIEQELTGTAPGICEN